MSDESIREEFDRCGTLYKDFFKQLSADDRQFLDIVASITNNSSVNKSIIFSPKTATMTQINGSNCWLD